MAKRRNSQLMRHGGNLIFVFSTTKLTIGEIITENLFLRIELLSAAIFSVELLFGSYFPLLSLPNGSMELFLTL